jgi:two-component system, chemotaxis family, response regulator PixG
MDRSLLRQALKVAVEVSNVAIAANNCSQIPHILSLIATHPTHVIYTCARVIAMNTMPMVSPKPFPSLHPLSLLAQFISQHMSGCLHVVTEAEAWSIYLDRGKLTYASRTVDLWDRLERHLHQLNQLGAKVPPSVIGQLRTQFERNSAGVGSIAADFQAIQWLVEQRYLSLAQATKLIEAIAKDVISAFLDVTTGSCQVLDQSQVEDFPHLCQLDLRALIEQCHHLRRRSHSVAPPPQPWPSAPSAVGATPLMPGAIAAPKSGYTIVCIDDSPTILRAINAFLDDATFSVLLINDPVKALMQVIRSKPDLILLDIEMPNLDGYELCSLLRRHPQFKQTPIVIATSNTGLIDRAKAKLVGASGYLTKPLTKPELLKTVFKHLS